MALPFGQEIFGLKKKTQNNEFRLETLGDYIALTHMGQVKNFAKKWVECLSTFATRSDFFNEKRKIHFCTNNGLLLDFGEITPKFLLFLFLQFIFENGILAFCHRTYITDSQCQQLDEPWQTSWCSIILYLFLGLKYSFHEQFSYFILAM